MKKVNFFKVMSACMAFAAVTFTSCSEEDMSVVTPGNTVIPEMPETPVIPATASVSVSVYGVSKNEASNVLLKIESIDATANIGSTMTVECPAIEGYIVAPAVTVAIPELKDGQSVVVPVAFYVATEGSAEAAIVDQINNNKPTFVEDITLFEEEETIANDKKLIITVPAEELEYYTGMEYVGETEKPASKAAATDYEFIASILKKTFVFGKEELPTVNKDGKEVRSFWMNPYHQTTVSYEQVGKKAVYEIEFNGSVYYAEFKIAKEATWTMAAHTVIPEYAHDWAHLHTHGHEGHDWHGGNTNAGGGIVEAE